MPAKYSHVKKRPAGQSKKAGSNHSNGSNNHAHHRNPNPHLDRHIDLSITQAVTAVSQLERAIARILLIRFEQDMARLFSTHLHCVALLHLPTFVMRCVTVCGPGWVAANADCDEIKDFFRAAIGMDLRQAGDRVATKSVLWSYTALRHFAMSHNVSICRKRGLHSLQLLPHYSALKAHLDTLEAMPAPAFAKPPHLGSLSEGLRALEDACGAKYTKDAEWRTKLRVGYERVCTTLWRVAGEFDVRGYGLVLREKLTNKWCDCGCSTDHLSEVCEKTVREDEEESGVRPGKEREWDGRGSGVYGWETEEEEDIWEIDFDFIGLVSEDNDDEGLDPDMTINGLMEWRYLRAEREKEQGNTAFKRGHYVEAIEHYKAAHRIEPEMSHYQLNLAAAHLKQQNCVAAERACDTALGQHMSLKGHWRRAQARKAQGRTEDAIKDLRAVLKIQPTNAEGLAELTVLSPADAPVSSPSFSLSKSAFSSTESSSSRSQPAGSTAATNLCKPLPFPRTDVDNRKLKIFTLPLTVDIPIDFIPFLNAKMAPLSSSKLITESFVYPNWERYVVQRVLD
ncbi:hypothetical protein SCP_1302310 [Sparassis crispa]|uniref:TPR-like protein n=1 Tax=Sparassis crispa TaxID=139825 RepID=A0A401H1U6_9APHY|nr:hypothetical protein SCP_1302310 [Sparassis crispa]GBE88416.1 hypothetical protein SCP_1302310 [Sparassis crispa]